ncbi:hypothetical protein [Synechococcus elongatus]|uniref:hypothetical protein n=1 Tax=Synechococcus elongatus TaxID=32046 RepID=UPI000F7F0A4A|nr:hypothetical protein [Synechococcus elongatus]
MTASGERISRFEAEIAASLQRINQLREDYQRDQARAQEQFESYQKAAQERFDLYQQTTQSLVNLAFGLIVSATIAVVVSVIFKS